jgi:phenylacetate-CoA ligase
MNWPVDLAGSTVQRVSDAQAHLVLERSGSAAIAAWQSTRLAELVQWLLDHVPWWRERLGTRVDLQHWGRLPVLSRFELRQQVAVHGAAPVPAAHGSVAPYQWAGPPGGAVRFYTSGFNQRMVDHAFYADHQRQGRNPYAHHAVISDDMALHDGSHMAVPASLEGGTGLQSLRQQQLFTRLEHVQWLQAVQPTYLTTTPDWLEAALDTAQAQRMALPEMRQLLTYGASVPESLRVKARTQLGASVRHRYTALECGPLAFQCPRSDDYFHTAVGNVLLEVVDEAGLPCVADPASGEAAVGRVLVTALHQYATPLVRHDIGDRAALHANCPGCGAEVPTLSHLQQNA